MDYDEQSQNSMPTTAGGARPLRAEPYDEPSAPTVVARGVADATLGQIDQYQLVRKLGGGGFGVVYLARDTVSGVDVALKTLHPLLKSNPEEMEALRAKFALVSRLSHPNIASPLVLHPCQRIAIADDGVRNEMRLSPGDFVMVMRYAPGVTLSKWRRQFSGGASSGRGRSPSAPPSVPLPLALEIGRQIASALDYAHGERIVHRDIKPANIMVETLGGGESHTEAQRHREGVERIRVRILDFGLAAEIRSSMSRISTEAGDTSGTRPYMAPEQWLGRKQDGRTDQYALACVAYELLSGAPPFAGVFETGDPAIMKDAVVRDSPEEIEGVPAHVNAALQKALAKNPKERFASCAEFVEGLSNAEAQGAPRNSHTETQGHRGNGAAKPDFRNPNPVSTSAISEADVLRRKLALTKAVKAIPAEDRADDEFSKFVGKAEDELAVAEDACKFGRFAAAAESLNAAESALGDLEKARRAREETERKAREEAERKVREEKERLARAEAERRAKEEVERKAREEQERKVREAAEQKAREAAELKARVEANHNVRRDVAQIVWEKADGGASSPSGSHPRRIWLWATVLAVLVTGVITIKMGRGVRTKPQRLAVSENIQEDSQDKNRYLCQYCLDLWKQGKYMLEETFHRLEDCPRHFSTDNDAEERVTLSEDEVIVVAYGELLTYGEAIANVRRALKKQGVPDDQLDAAVRQVAPKALPQIAEEFVMSQALRDAAAKAGISCTDEDIVKFLENQKKSDIVGEYIKTLRKNLVFRQSENFPPLFSKSAESE